MVFSSIDFLCAFLPVVFILYTALSAVKTDTRIKLQNILLLAASLAFYAYGEPVYVLLLIGSALINYLAALLISSKNKELRKPVLIAAVILDLAVLCMFKYTGMFVESFNALSGLSVPVPRIVLPIGISFFTFQALSYVIDVYRGETAAQKNFALLLLYISLFPQLIAGPIVKFHEIDRELTERRQTVSGTAKGLRRFIVGLSKKVLISNTLAVAADAVFGAQAAQLNVLSGWIGAAAYMLQIYYDFSGYSDMALGMGEMFGFHFCENFNYPYCSLNMRDFWRRWHISLSSWFRDYLYIPLGGNRKGKLRTGINKMIVFFCTGLWHGASWTFVIWGLYHGFFLLLEEYLPKREKKHPVLSRIYTLLAVCFGFVIFRADTIGGALSVMKSMLFGWKFGEASSLALSVLSPLFIAVFICACIGAVPLKEKICSAGETLGIKREALSTASYIGAFLLLLLCVISLSGSTYNPFIYFRF